MINDPYSPRVRELFDQPAHAGDVDGAVRVRTEDQGVRIALAATTDGGVICALRFRAWGCPHLLAAAEAVCREYEGKPWAALEAYRATGLMQSLPVPTEKMSRILVLEDAVRLLGQKIRERSNA